MKRRHLGIALVAIISLSQVSVSFGDLAFGGRLGTLGLGSERMLSSVPVPNGRAGITYRPLGVRNVDSNSDPKMLTVPLTLDWYPFPGSFHLSGGILVNGTKIGLNTKSSATFGIGGTTCSAADVGQLRGDATYNPIAPYVGLGWSSAFGKEQRWGILADIGVAFIGRPHASITAEPVATHLTFQSILDQDQDSIRHDLGRSRFYPVISVSLFFRF